MAYKIESGDIDDLDVSGLTIAMLANIPGNVTAGNWKVIMFVDAEANDEWTRRISASASDVRGLVEGIAGRMREVSAGTEDYAAAAQQIAAASQPFFTST